MMSDPWPLLVIPFMSVLATPSPSHPVYGPSNAKFTVSPDTFQYSFIFAVGLTTLQCKYALERPGRMTRFPAVSEK